MASGSTLVASDELHQGGIRARPTYEGVLDREPTTDLPGIQPTFLGEREGNACSRSWAPAHHGSPNDEVLWLDRDQSAARAALATRDFTVSARLVSTSGTLVPRTIPATSAPAMYTKLL